MDNLSNLRILLDAIPQNVVVYRYVDGDFIFVYFNDLAEKTENIKREELIDKRLVDIFPKVKEFGLYDVLLNVYESGVSQELNIGFYEDERISGWRHNTVNKLDNGYLLVIYSDVTQQKELEKKALLQQEKLQNLGYIIDNSINEVYIFNVEDLHFTYINSSAEKNIGYTLEEMKSLTPVDVKKEYTVKSFQEVIKPLLIKEKEFIVFETIHERKDKSIYNVEVRLQIMSINNQEQIVVFANDITERKSAELNLKESEEKFRNIADYSLTGIFIYHEHYVYANEEFANITGYTMNELYSLRPCEIVEESYREWGEKIVQRRLNGEKFQQDYKDLKIVTKNGQLKTVRITTKTIKYQGAYAGMGTIMDITDITEMKKQVKLLSQAVEQMDELVRITDKNGIITFANDAFVSHTGYRQIDLIGTKNNILKSGKHDHSFYKNMWDTILSGKTFRGVFINKKRDNTFYYEEETITPIIDSDNIIQHFVATGIDITERIKTDEKLHKLATIDTLTEIYNRYKISEELDVEIARAKRYGSVFSLIMIDVDNFKKINDTHGHDVGDYVLRELCTVLSNHIRESDRFGRWGGEEFIIVSPEIDNKSDINFCEKLRKAVEIHPFKHIEKITISIGSTTYKKDDIKENLLKRVDDALYDAKESGRNTVKFD